MKAISLQTNKKEGIDFRTIGIKFIFRPCQTMSRVLALVVLIATATGQLRTETKTASFASYFDTATQKYKLIKKHAVAPQNPQEFYYQNKHVESICVPDIAMSVEFKGLTKENEDIMVQCCYTDLKNPVWDRKARALAKHGSKTLGGCTFAKTWDEAAFLCSSVNARLCSNEEMIEGRGKNTACGEYDGHYAWTATKCSVDGVIFTEEEQELKLQEAQGAALIDKKNIRFNKVHKRINDVMERSSQLDSINEVNSLNSKTDGLLQKLLEEM